MSTRVKALSLRLGLGLFSCGTASYRVLSLDLGGHGESGTDRDPWPLRSLGQAHLQSHERFNAETRKLLDELH